MPLPLHRHRTRFETTAAEQRFLLDVDGEALESLPLSVQIMPGLLRVRA
jgi:diacylglycerol kinase family enzyme